MNRFILFIAITAAVLVAAENVEGRGFGGFRGGGSFGGYRGGGFSSFSGGDRFGGSYSGSRNVNSYSGWGRGASGSYDHTWSNAAGGSLSTSGTRDAYRSPFGFSAAGGSRDTTLTTAGGKTYSADRSGGFASGPLGRTVGGASGSINGRYGTSNWSTAFAGNRYAGPMAHYSSFGAATAHGTAYWSGGYMTAHGAAVRGGFGYYHCFNPGWYARYPGCWVAAGWAANAAWTAATYNSLAGYCSLPAEPTNYDYGSDVVINNNQVYINGQDQGTTQQYADQATTLADKGQTAAAPADADWKPIGVFALVQGSEETSNNIFQLAINKDGVIRGNYYDGLMDTTTEVFGSVDKTTGRAAWTIGKKKDRVFDAGLDNLTKGECPCLIHLGSGKSTQMLLVRVEQPKADK